MVDLNTVHIVTGMRSSASSIRPQIAILWIHYLELRFLDKHPSDFQNVDSFGKRGSADNGHAAHSVNSDYVLITLRFA